MVLNKVVARVCDPERRRCLISVQQRPTSLGLHNQVLVDVVILFNCIFNKNGMALDIKGNVLHKAQIVSSVNCKGSVV